MTHGVVYLLHGMGAAERLAVSVYSLRNHWCGSITILTGDAAERAIARRIANGFNCRVLLIQDMPDNAMLAKTRIPEWTPYGETLYLDADTVVVGAVDELFDYALTLTQEGCWVSTGKRVGKWIRSWRDKIEDHDCLEWLEIQLAHSWPAINTGVFAFRRDNHHLDTWRKIAEQCPDMMMVDQLAMQIATSVIPYRLLDDRFNHSPTHGMAMEDIRVHHFHGRKHCRSRRVHPVWEKAFAEAMEANIGGLQEWAGKYDRDVARWLNAG